jgi:N-methylhydantoinase A/oxoprolinase/acetone carboxylase beta subunit
VLSFDVGGTTTDIGLVADGRIKRLIHGHVEGVECSFPLSDIVSVGVGGGSIFRCVDGRITVGPDSVGGAPGPACFGLGGQQPTITDALLLMGLFDPRTYFGGSMALDVDRARAVVQERIATPLGVTVATAVHEMLKAWADKIGVELQRYADVTPETILLAFGGGGPLAVLTVAEAIGAKRVLVPRLAAVFSAFGIGFSSIGHVVEAPLSTRTDDGLSGLLAELKERACRDMFSEGFEAGECELEAWLTTGDREVALDIAAPRLGSAQDTSEDVVVTVRASKAIDRPVLPPLVAARPTAVSPHATRRLVMSDGSTHDMPVVRVEDQVPGGCGTGPVLLEEKYWTCHVPQGWSFEFSSNGDVLFDRVR